MRPDAEDIELLRQGRVAKVIFNRPTVGNAFSRNMYAEVYKILEKLETDTSVGAIVFTGKGKHFSAGGDINRFKELIESGQFSYGRIHYVGSSVNACNLSVFQAYNCNGQWRCCRSGFFLCAGLRL